MFRLEKKDVDLQSYNEQFQEYGYVNNLSIITLQTNFYYFMIFPLHFVILFILHLISSKFAR